MVAINTKHTAAIIPYESCKFKRIAIALPILDNKAVPNAYDNF